MNDGLKQRIVGALVLLALAVIFLPVLFDKERIAPVDRVSQIPLAPEIIPAQLPEPAKRPQPMDPMLEAPIVDGTFDAAEYTEENPDSVSEQDPSLELSTEGVPRAWVLQVASYKNYEQAVEVRDGLIAEGYKSFVKKANTSLGTHTRLFVGPSLDRDLLEQHKKKIDDKYAVDSILSEFKPAGT
jgi:DedD protein